MEENKKTVSVVVPIYNEEAMVTEIYDRVSMVFDGINCYTYEIVFFDDGSTDGTRAAIEALCMKHQEVKSVFYTRNFGYLKNIFYCMQQAKGDCAILIHADLQNPPELISEFLQKWENQTQVVLGVKNKSRENKMMYFLRSVFYFLMIRFFRVELTPHATDFYLFDRSFIELLQRIKTNNPFLRGIVNEYASTTAYVFYTQDKRKKGKSKFNLNKYYDFAICGITTHSVILPRRVIIVCMIAMLASIAEFCFVFIPHSAHLNLTSTMNSIILRCIVLVLCLLVILVCVLFEYVIALLKNTGEKPPVVEKKRIKY